MTLIKFNLNPKSVGHLSLPLSLSLSLSVSLSLSLSLLLPLRYLAFPLDSQQPSRQAKDDRTGH